MLWYARVSSLGYFVRAGNYQNKVLSLLRALVNYAVERAVLTGKHNKPVSYFPMKVPKTLQPVFVKRI